MENITQLPLQGFSSLEAARRWSSTPTALSNAMSSSVFPSLYDCLVRGRIFFP